ncbi:MAG: bifunctional oligoribonuclease/PAP phosphatase NrnA [Candidatus Aureabacteria bacterium]|nr:bifunctional oligoribonuclease/PAP phosphatase NrnA [Candidatus Auribacterota bacterium]
MNSDHLNESFEQLKQVIDSKKRFIISSHINPDGDSIGSEIAFYNLLKNLGKDVLVINSSMTPDNCLFLEGANEILEYPQLRADEIEFIKKTDVLVLLDVSEYKRVGLPSKILEPKSLFTVCIDHHILSHPSMNLSIIKEDACATGEIIFKFMKYAGCKITMNIAEAIYVSILTDTGSFQYSNTTAESHLIAAELLSMGINHSYIYEKYYCNQPMKKAKLFISVISTLQTECDGKIAWMKMTKDMLALTDTRTEDSEGIINFAMNIKGVRVILFFKELTDERIKVSLRSRKKFNVRNVAASFGGGGHNNASGILLKGILDEVIQKILKRVEEELKKQECS